MIATYDVPEKHAFRVALKPVKRGGPFDTWHAIHTMRQFQGIAVEEKKVVAILVSLAFFNRIHLHLHGFTMSVFGDMSERKPVWIEGYRIEPSCVLDRRI